MYWREEFAQAMNMELSGDLFCRCQSEVSSQCLWEWCSFPKSLSSQLAIAAKSTLAHIVEGSSLRPVTLIATSVPTQGKSRFIATTALIAPAENLP